MKNKQINKFSGRKPQRRIKIHKAVKKKQTKQFGKTKRKAVKKMKTSQFKQLPIPQHFDRKTVDVVRRVDYEELAVAAEAWRRKHNLLAASSDSLKIALLLVDPQITFGIPGYELFVKGRSGIGAVEDNVRLCEFIYRYLAMITIIVPTMDTHTLMQIFHQFMFVNEKGEHPKPIVTPINSANLKSGEWKINPEVAWSLSEDKSPSGVARTYNALKEHDVHYCETLEKNGKFSLTIWPYHAMLGGIGHAIVPAVEEACFFHNIARASQTRFEIKGGNPLTENYSILRPEVLTGKNGNAIAQKNARFIRTLLTSDRVIIAGQAKSHCVAWTIDDLLTEINSVDPNLAKKVYLLEDCTSSVTVPNPAGGFFVDYTDEADKAFARFAKAGMHIVKSTDPIDSWPGFAS